MSCSNFRRREAYFHISKRTAWTKQACRSTFTEDSQGRDECLTSQSLFRSSIKTLWLELFTCHTSLPSDF